MSDFQPNLFQADAQGDGPVECLGMTFESDEARREYFLEILREKLKDPEFRKIEGFPIGEDEDILALSDPPYYTACPNPFLEKFIECYGKPYDPETDNYHREPFAADVSEGKGDPLYNAHSYHTKVPHKAIMRYLLHYTEPGDVVLDGFSGSGMLGVAAQSCANPETDLKISIEQDRQNSNLPSVKWGKRLSILNDLSPAATFISANYISAVDVKRFEIEALKLLRNFKSEYGWMYETTHPSGNLKGEINYTIWSEVFLCPECSEKIIFYNDALDHETKRVNDIFSCPSCGVDLKKNNLQRLMESSFDHANQKTVSRIKFIPVAINYKIAGKNYEKRIEPYDLEILEKVNNWALDGVIPYGKFPIENMYHGSRLKPKGFTHIHHLYLSRPAYALGYLWKGSLAVDDYRIRNMLLFMFEQAIRGMSLLNRYKPIQFGKIGGSQVGLDLSGVYYVPSISTEVSPDYQFRNKLKRLVKVFSKYVATKETSCISTGTASQLKLSEGTIDYIFTDPPFGENIFYADLNFLVETWHKIKTNTYAEAIIDKPKNKKLFDYQKLMHQCFTEYYRVLKPGRWMTVVFHNSRNSVWNAIQEAINSSGFVIADVRTLDKRQGSYRQVTSTATKQDLIITAYKPAKILERTFRLEAGSIDAVWGFILNHLDQLPVFVAHDGKVEVLAERQNYLLFDRMVAFHVQHGVTVPISASEFYVGLDQRFPKRDGMYFLPEQIAEYDRRRMTVREILQLDLFVNNESTAVQWLRQQLTKKPQTFQELHPQFLKIIGGWSTHEQLPELSDLLGQNFLCYSDGNIPKQVVSWLAKSSTHRTKLTAIFGADTDAATNLLDVVPDTGLETDETSLIAAAKDRWYIPDPNRAIDLEKLREKSLLKEFEEYRNTKKKIKVFRMEAMRVGFKHYFQQREYKTIIEVARKIPEKILQEDQKLLMFYDNAVTRAGED